MGDDLIKKKTTNESMTYAADLTSTWLEFGGLWGADGAVLGMFL